MEGAGVIAGARQYVQSLPGFLRDPGRRAARHRRGLPAGTRIKRLVVTLVIVASLIVAAVTVMVITLQTATTGDSAGIAPPAGYSKNQLIFDDLFAGTSLNTAHWNTAMGGQGDRIWNSDGLPAGDSAAGTQVHQTYFSPSQVTVSNGLNLTMVPDTKYSSLGYGYRSGVVTSYDKFTLTSGYVQIKAKMSDSSRGGWPAIWFIDPSSGGGSQEIDLQEGGFTPSGAGLPSDTPVNNILMATYHTPSGTQSDFAYAAPTPMNAGFNTYGMEYIPGRSIKTYFNGRLVGSWSTNISTAPYEIVIWNSQASSSTSGFHTIGVSPNPSDMSVAEVQAYALSP
jgi:beta-glucanase (GH16 family)